MPTLNWIGKEAVVNHHLDVKFHLLKALCRETLRVIAELCAAHGGVEGIVVYGTSQRLAPARLKREGITFKQIPYSIREK